MEVQSQVTNLLKSAICIDTEEPLICLIQASIEEVMHIQT